MVIQSFLSQAFIAIITNPVNSTVPIAIEVMKNNGIDAKKRIFGVTTLDVVRAQAFVSELKVRREKRRMEGEGDDYREQMQPRLSSLSLEDTPESPSSPSSLR